MPRSELPAREAPPSEEPYAELAVGTHRLALLRDGAQTFPAMLAAIAAARRSICLETYILREGRVASRFGDALSAKARAGIEVSLMYDALGTALSSTYLGRLRDAGVRTLAYHPLRLRGRRREVLGKLARRDHRKVLVVDSSIGFAGGINLCDDYLPPPEGAGWRDTHLRLEGPAAVELEYFFLNTWRHERGEPFDESRYGANHRRADPSVSIVCSHVRHARTGIRDAYREAIRTARQRIWITNAYFLPQLRFLRDLGDAARRGVDVRVMVPATTDIAAVLYASRAIYQILLDQGVRMFEWEGRVLHAKTAVIDDRWSTVGSSNLDAQSLRHNLEINAILRSEAFASALERMFLEDLAFCHEIYPESWRRRSTVGRVVSFAAYLFRDFL